MKTNHIFFITLSPFQNMLLRSIKLDHVCQKRWYITQISQYILFFKKITDSEKKLKNIIL
jgi:hypothetical protein